ncbi:MAG TPA: LLM class flavin-dependent oxidoreductase [Thermomicrobiales bacterium]|nr:LLM class flavin-dependent oxidoreductase [Thermomicrobiales bacterium]
MDYGFGVAGALDRDIVARLAPELEQLGYRTLWVNDTPNGDSLASCATALEGTERLRAGTGVIPVDRRSGSDVSAATRELGLDLSRITIGIGSGQAKRPLQAVSGAIADLREDLGGDASIAVGALGPKMTELAATTANDVLLNWLTPAGATESAAVVRRVAAQAKVDRPRVTLYVRVATDPAAFGRLQDEAARYESYPAYAANFRRFGVSGIDTVVGTDDQAEAKARLAMFVGSIDEVVVRAITVNETYDDYLALARVCAPVGD